MPVCALDAIEFDKVEPIMVSSVIKKAILIMLVMFNNTC